MEKRDFEQARLLRACQQPLVLGAQLQVPVGEARGHAFGDAFGEPWDAILEAGGHRLGMERRKFDEAQVCDARQ